MSFARIVEPEWLDQLPPDDPRAVRSRRDLIRINALMRHASIMARTLVAHCGSEPPKVWVDLGAGGGTFTLGVARRLAPRWPQMRVVLVDRQAIVGDAVRRGFAELGWTVETVTADLFDFLGQAELPAADVVTANLFLHHFAEVELARLLAAIARWPRLFVACEPRRSTLVREMSRLLWVIGCNDVSIHDAIASTRAGFRGTEISQLWPSGHRRWQLHEHSAGPFSHCFIARSAPSKAHAPSPIAHLGSG